MKSIASILLLLGLAACGKDDDQKWYRTCGDPVCGPGGHRSDPNVSACTGTQTVAASCTALGELCDPNDPCNVRLVCATEDPTMQPGGCPISRRETKRDVAYLEPKDLDRVARELLGVRLATYNYRGEPSSNRSRLGFIIDDQPKASPAVQPDGRTVDLYGFASMIAATAQSQAQKIAALEAESRELRRRLEALERIAASSPGARHP
jgi:hypothetical protein